MITTVTLNPTIDREYFVEENLPGEHQYIYDDYDINVSPGGKGLISAINLKHLGYSDVQNIGFVGGQQGLFFEKMVQEHKVTTNYIYTEQEMRNNIYIVGKDPVTYTHYNDYTYEVTSEDVERLIKRFKRGIADSELIMISGSIPVGIEKDIYKELVRICHNQDREVYLYASGETLNRALSEEPKFVTPYFKYTDKILKQPVESIDEYVKGGRKLQEEGAKYAMIPFHSGRLVFPPDKVYSLGATEFSLVNWLGAGDAYGTAFFDYIFREGLDFLEANRYAGAAALAVAEKREVFLEERAEIKNNLKRIKVKEVGT